MFVFVRVGFVVCSCVLLCFLFQLFVVRCLLFVVCCLFACLLVCLVIVFVRCFCVSW